MSTKRKNSKKKGSNFELLIAKKLSLWWQEDFHRTPASGGLHWQRDNRVSGDIVTPEGSNFPFSIECKKREGWNFEQILANTGDVADWWEQCIRDAESVLKSPLLVFSKNRSPIYIMMWEKPFFDIFGVEFDGRYFQTIMENDYWGKQKVVIAFFDDLTSIPKETVLQRSE